MANEIWKNSRTSAKSTMHQTGTVPLSNAYSADPKMHP